MAFQQLSRSPGYMGSPGKSGDGGKGRISITVIEDCGLRIADCGLRIGYLESSERSEILKAPITTDMNSATPARARPTDHPQPAGSAVAFGIPTDGTDLETLCQMDEYQLALGPIHTSPTPSAI